MGQEAPLCVPGPCWWLGQMMMAPQPSSDNVNNDAHSSDGCASVPQFVLSRDLFSLPAVCPWREYRGLGCSVCNSMRTVASETFGRWI